ncbi:DNA/RNA non-specific endonuclease [Rhodobacter sp. SY28-1]|uniref:DNA/RNA non-specific endonuclease n=1 Tax=Rhodobacter sp. SY28-1 TaxID=2562317 RepID=UPI0010C10B4F|nr:DNA/RNA non-specific endonuclease [Rhodobacter sp. SY28-1]
MATGPKSPTPEVEPKGKARRKGRNKEAAPNDGPSEAALRSFIRAKGAEYLKDPNITSIGIGLKNGNGPVCIQFTVGEKGESAIEALGSERIPESIEVDGHAVLTDVIARRYRPSYELVAPEQLDARRQRRDPIQPGISVAITTETAGTLGLVVFDRATGLPCILSNWHVLHGNRGTIGDQIVQPGPFDDNNTSGNRAGSLLRSHLGAAGDCALAKIELRDWKREVFELDVVPSKMANVALGDRVIKSGRTTGLTHGIVRRVDVMAKLDYDLPAGKVAIGGFEIGVDPKNPPVDGEVSKGGDSGSAWLISKAGKPTDIFAGLHFAGESGSTDDEHALACYALSVQKKLDFVLESPAVQAPGVAKSEPADFRSGYDPEFLGLPVPEPELSTSLKRDALNFGRRQTIPYAHFSVCLSQEKKMARYVSWNVDGARMVKLPRRGFALDPRIDAKYQTGESLYWDNKLDRGHLARRADLCWGTLEEAQVANKDSFYFPNIVPQHQGFNQSKQGGLWGKLEDLVFNQTDVLKIRISVMAGPIFSDEDMSYRGVKVPQSFWKLIAYRAAADEELRCAAFLLSQSNLMHDIERLELDPFRLYQVGLATLTQLSGLGFEKLTTFDTLLRPEHVGRVMAEGAGEIIEILAQRDIRL